MWIFQNKQKEIKHKINPMIDNIHLLDLETDDLHLLYIRAKLPMINHKVRYKIVAADPITVHILATQAQTAMITPAQTIHDVAVDLFTPFVPGRNLYVTALPYNKDPNPAIDLSNSKDLLNALWLFLTNDTMPDKATISREAFNHEVGTVIELLQAKQ